MLSPLLANIALSVLDQHFTAAWAAMGDSSARHRLSDEKTRICHIDDGFDFLGFRIQRQPKRGSGKPTVYTWPTKKALCTVKAKVGAATRQGLHQPLAVLLYRLAPILRAGPATSASRRSSVDRSRVCGSVLGQEAGTTAADVITFLIVSALIFAVLELVDRISGR